MNRESPPLILTSPAKINIFLEVLGRRPDGFHELETVMLRINLCDTLRFECCEDKGVRLQLASSPEPFDAAAFPLNDTNLIIKAALALQQATGQQRGALISVDKRIPMEAGLAGGSSNAATTLMGLNQLWDLRLTAQDLHEVAARIGSDVNFFVENCRAAVCRGRGERVSPLEMSGGLHGVLVRPQTGNSTPCVFEETSVVTNPVSAVAITEALRHGQLEEIEACGFNRLTASAESLNSAMASLRAEVLQICHRPAFMSGSGSTCFVFAQSARQADEFRAAITAAVSNKLGFISTFRV